MSTLKRHVKDLGKRGLRRFFEAGQRLGVDILPRHFYSEIPDVSALRADDAWKMPRSMVGINGVGIAEQLHFLESCCPAEVRDRLHEGDIYPRACATNGEPGFGPVEADFLFAFIHTQRPKRVVQIGCGVSTAVMLLAAREAGFRLELICIEPYPTEYLKAAGRRDEIELIPEKAQKVPLELLTDLGGGGMLFVDSSHAVGPGSEVNRVILEVLPRLKTGDWAHFHDIYFPYDYQRGLLSDDLFFCNESALLQAFLANNPRYSIRGSLSMLHYNAPDALRDALPNYVPASNEHGLRKSDGHFPASTYLQVIGE